MTRYVIPFEEIRSTDVVSVGGKNASLGEMISKGIRVPSGFAVTADAYMKYLEHNDLFDPITKLLSDLDVTNVEQLRERGSKIRSLIYNGNFPEAMKEAIIKNYKQIEERYGPNVSCASRSSATAEDLPTASFAGQQDTYLNVSGVGNILDSVKKCMASLFTNRAITYRKEKGFEHMKVQLSVGVQKMVKSYAAGVLFTIDADTGNENVLWIRRICCWWKGNRR